MSVVSSMLIEVSSGNTQQLVVSPQTIGAMSTSFGGALLALNVIVSLINQTVLHRRGLGDVRLLQPAELFAIETNANLVLDKYTHLHSLSSALETSVAAKLREFVDRHGSQESARDAQLRSVRELETRHSNAVRYENTMREQFNDADRRQREAYRAYQQACNDYDYARRQKCDIGWIFVVTWIHCDNMSSRTRSAEYARDRADNYLTSANNWRNSASSSYNSAISETQSVYNSLQAARSQLSSIEARVQELRRLQHSATDLVNMTRSALEHTQTLKDRSETFRNTAGTVIDVSELKYPLEQIAKALMEGQHESFIRQIDPQRSAVATANRIRAVGSAIVAA